ncbi:hypothetical protein OG21DRAFT_1607271 [Imleria badia]|nr:hypothetical protein OG21DRAFT_1607271 [Imleria badia]
MYSYRDNFHTILPAKMRYTTPLVLALADEGSEIREVGWCDWYDGQEPYPEVADGTRDGEGEHEGVERNEIVDEVTNRQVDKDEGESGTIGDPDDDDGAASYTKII